MTGTVRSKDGTTIGFDCVGSGQPLVLVDGALCYRDSGPMRGLADALAQHFTVYFYDRRGRGESGNTEPYAVEREIEDLEAVIAQAGGAAHVMGISSGAALALAAAVRGSTITRLALYEAPFIVDNSREPVPADWLPRLKTLIAADRRSDAVKMFMRLVGVPRVFVALMPLMPVWSKLKAIAPTLVHDITITQPHQQGRPYSSTEWASVSAPTIVMDGGKSPAWMRNAMRSLAHVVPRAKYRTLDGQTHMVKATVLAPALIEFFAIS